MQFKELTKRIDQWIFDQEKKEAEKEKFLKNVDLGKDKIEEYKKITFQNTLCELKRFGYSEDDANALCITALKKLENALSTMPDYFNSNHFYKKLTTLSPSDLADYAIGKDQTKTDETIIKHHFFKK